MVVKVVAAVIALSVGMVLTSTPSYASTKVSPSKGKIIIMAGPPVCCGVVS